MVSLTPKSKHENDLPDIKDKTQRIAVDPWGMYPDRRSRIADMGGTEESPDPSYVFQTAPMLFETGQVTLTLRIGDMEAGPGFLFLALSNGSKLPGSLMSRLILEPIDLACFKDDQPYILQFKAYRNVGYTLSGSIHGTDEIRARNVRIAVDPPAAFVEHHLRRTEIGTPPLHDKKDEEDQDDHDFPVSSRLIEIAEPNFEQLHSQPFTDAQLLSETYRETHEKLHGTRRTADEASWADAFVYRAVSLFGPRDQLEHGIAIDDHDRRLSTQFLKEGARITLAMREFDPEALIDVGKQLDALLAQQPEIVPFADRLDHSLIGDAIPPEYGGNYDFSWWITLSPIDTSAVIKSIFNVMASIREGGIGVAVFPIGMADEGDGNIVNAKTDLPRIIIDILASGYQLVQIRMPSSASGVAPFGLIMRRACGVL